MGRRGLFFLGWSSFPLPSSSSLCNLVLLALAVVLLLLLLLLSGADSYTPVPHERSDVLYINFMKHKRTEFLLCKTICAL